MAEKWDVVSEAPSSSSGPWNVVSRSSSVPPDPGSPEEMLGNSRIFGPPKDRNALPWNTDTLGQRVFNPLINMVTDSLPKTVSSLYHAATRPVETVSGLGRLMLGAYGGIGSVPGSQYIPQEYKDAARQAVTPEHSLAYTLATDPVGVASAVLPGVGPGGRAARLAFETDEAVRMAATRTAAAVRGEVSLVPGAAAVARNAEAVRNQFGFGGRPGAEKAAAEPFRFALGKVDEANDAVPVAQRAVQNELLAEKEVGLVTGRVVDEANRIAAALRKQEDALPAVTEDAAKARATVVSSAEDFAAAQRLLDEEVLPVLPPVPSRTVVGESAQSQLAAAEKLLKETHRAEAAAARIKVDSAATSLESTGKYIGDTPAAQDLLTEIGTVLRPSPSTVSTTAMRLEQRSTDVLTFNKQVEEAIRNKKVFLNETQAKEARDLGYKVDLEQAATPSSLGKDGKLIPGEDAVYSRTLKSGYEAVDEVGRFLGQVYEGTAARGYDAIAAAEARRLYDRIQGIKKSYLPKGVQAEFNSLIQRHIAAKDAFSRQGAGGGAVERAGNIERLETLPVAELDKILSETTSVQNFARAVGAEGDASAAALVEQEVARKLSGLDYAGIQKALASKESLGDIFTNLDRLGDAGAAAKDRIQGYIGSVANREKLAEVLGSAKEKNVAAATALTKAETTLTTATADLEKARIASQKAQDAVGATEKTINEAAAKVAARRADVTKAKDLVATRKNEASQLDPAMAKRDVDELIKNLKAYLTERSNLSVDNGGLSRTQIDKARVELERVSRIRDNVARNKQLAKILAIYGGVPAAGVSTGIYITDR